MSTNGLVAFTASSADIAPIAVIDYFDVAIIPKFCHEIYLRFSALGRMPGRTSWSLNALFVQIPFTVFHV